jgi:hypothetical protein
MESGIGRAGFKTDDFKQIVRLPGDKYRVLGYNKILRNI